MRPFGRKHKHSLRIHKRHGTTTKDSTAYIRNVNNIFIRHFSSLRAHLCLNWCKKKTHIFEDENVEIKSGGKCKLLFVSSHFRFKYEFNLF